MRVTDLPAITFRGQTMDTSEECFGELRHSGDLIHDAEALRERIEEDGYLLLDGLLDRDEVMATNP